MCLIPSKKKRKKRIVSQCPWRIYNIHKHRCVPTVGTHPSPFHHVVLDDLLRARRVHGAIDERLVPVRIVVLQHHLARVLPVLAVHVVRAAVTARTSHRRVAQRGRLTQTPHTIAVQVGHVPTCWTTTTTTSFSARRASGWEGGRGGRELTGRRCSGHPRGDHHQRQRGARCETLSGPIARHRCTTTTRRGTIF